MERRRVPSKGPAKPKKRPPTDQATTALGKVAEKRGLKSIPSKEKSGAAGQREMRVNVKTAKGRKVSSTLWLDRQLNDPYVARAKAEGYRSRAAYKLKELDEKFGLLKEGARVVDLGCAPGGWLQVAAEKGAARVVGVDYLAMPHVPGTEHLELDFLDDGAPEKLTSLLGGEADLVLSDMAAPTTGHKATDHLRIIALADAALDFAEDVLAPGGAFVCKVFQGGAEGDLLARLKKNFATVKHAKPRASRADSAEMYVVAMGFKGTGV
jgi:23S rRNA (uridine2552-2'-O)-methyltransferase